MRPQHQLKNMEEMEGGRDTIAVELSVNCPRPGLRVQR
jgi:hypothetical protein